MMLSELIRNRIFRPGRLTAPAIVVISIFLCGAQLAKAQDDPMGSAARDMAAALRKAHVRSVVLFDFTASDPSDFVFEHRLADDFSDVLKHSDKKLRVKSSEPILKVISENHLEAEN